MATAAPKRKQTHIPSDFKRRKAKVGKRALTPANETNVKFKSVTVGVRSQSVVVGHHQVSGITSGKGKSIAELTHQLSHPAIPVRISACKGLLDLATCQNHATEILEAHLSTLLPPVLKCTLDEGDIVRQLGWSCVRNVLTKCKATMRPFLPLLTAFISSGLYSLDRDIRFDSSQGVEIVSGVVGDMMERDMILKILPSYITLLSDFGPRKTDMRGDELSAHQHGKKKSKESREGKRFQVLASLLSLCKAMKHENKETAQLEKVLNVAEHAVVLLTAPEHRHSIAPVSNMLSLRTITDYSRPENSISVETMETDLLSKLRDIFIEVIQRGTEVDSGGTDLPAQEVEEVFILIGIVGRLHGFLVNVKDSIYIQLLKIILPAFPFHAASKEHASRYETLNGDICELVMKLSSNEEEKIVEYLLTSPPTATVVKVLSKFLVTKLSLASRTLILERLKTSFFDDVSSDLARSMAGRRAARMVHYTLAQWNFEIDAMEELSEMLSKLPLYLGAWKGDFLDESSCAISTLHEVVRRLDVNDVKRNGLVESLRENLIPIFTSNKKTIAILEAYPDTLQRKAISLLVLMQGPKEATLIGLSYTCTRIEPAIADYTLDVMHMVRRSVSMQIYFNFIVTSMGLPKPRKQKISNASNPPTFDVKSLLEHDPAVLRASRAFVRCGSSKVLPLVWPVILSWLEQFSADSELDLGLRLVYFRAAVNTLTYFSLDLSALSSCLVSIIPDWQAAMTNAVTKLFLLYPTAGNSSSGVLHDAFPYLMKPLVSLFIKEPLILHTVFFQAKQDILAMESSTMEALLSLVRDTRLAETLRQSAESISCQCRDIKTGLAGGPLERQGETLLTSLVLVVGQI